MRAWETCYRDSDSDGFGDPNDSQSICGDNNPDGYVANNADCDDTNAAINPNATEVCNGIDDNCSGSVDDVTDPNLLTTYYEDFDGDSYGNLNSATAACSAPAGYVEQIGDCNDRVASIYPGATEVCNGVDDNCSGTVDDVDDLVTLY